MLKQLKASWTKVHFCRSGKELFTNQKSNMVTKGVTYSIIRFTEPLLLLMHMKKRLNSSKAFVGLAIMNIYSLSTWKLSMFNMEVTDKEQGAL